MVEGVAEAWSFRLCLLVSDAFLFFDAFSTSDTFVLWCLFHLGHLFYLWGPFFLRCVFVLQPLCEDIVWRPLKPSYDGTTDLLIPFLNWLDIRQPLPSYSRLLVRLFIATIHTIFNVLFVLTFHVINHSHPYRSNAEKFKPLMQNSTSENKQLLIKLAAFELPIMRIWHQSAQIWTQL